MNEHPTESIPNSSFLIPNSYILGFDASTRVLSVAVSRGARILADFSVNDTLTHSQNLLPAIDTALRCCGIGVEQIGAVAVTRGPGSYTGVRIGVATAKGLLFGRDNCACVPVCTLEALAWAARHRFAGLLPERCVICPALDARRGQVYCALYMADGETITELEPPRAADSGWLADRLAEDYGGADLPILAVGDGAGLVRAQTRELLRLPEGTASSCAAGACLRARALLEAGTGAVEPEKLAPMYLRGY